ncbi:MAG: ABC transporter ATP-binding protein [Pseudomonadota bacterium]
MEPLLRVEGLSMSFGGVRALDGVSFTAEGGAITAMIGPNGAGKTTAINCISGAYHPQAGRVFFAGEDVTGLASHRLARRGLTRTFQNLQVFAHLSVLENVMVGLHAVTGQGFVGAVLRLPAMRAEERVIHDRAMATLETLDLTRVAHRPAGQLSYGDRKRLELARALVARPRLVLLDEPVAGLNASETDAMGRALAAAREHGVGLVLVEHDMALVMKISDQVVVLSFGQKIAQGDPHQVQNDPQVLSTYLGGTEAPVNGYNGHGAATGRAAHA